MRARFVDKYDSGDEERIRPGGPVDLGRLLQALRRHWRVLPVAAAIGAVLGFGASVLWVKPAYTGRATLLWEPLASAEPSSRSFVTQVDSIKLPVNLIEVRKRLHSKLTLEELQQKINLVFDGQSHLVVVEFTDATSRAAARAANTVVQVFLDYERRVARTRGSERLEAIETDTKLARDRLAEVRAGFEGFRKQHGVSDFALETAAAIRTVSRLQEDAAAAHTQALAEERKVEELTAELERTPAELSPATRSSNPVETELAQLRTELALELAHLAPDHPKIVRLKAAIAALESQPPGARRVQDSVDAARNPLHQTLQSQLSDAKVAKAAALSREQTARAAHESASLRLQQLTAADGEARHFTSRIQLLETRLNELEAQRTVHSDNVRNAQADFRVVTAASAPERSNPSQRRALAIQFPLAALAFALLGIIGRELRGLRVHTARETAFWANVPVIASTTWPREASALGLLVDELNDAAAGFRGTTLVVGGRVHEAPLAREVAYWLSHLTSDGQRLALASGNSALNEPARGASNVHVAAELGAVEHKSDWNLARRRDDLFVSAWAWDGPPHGLALRRAARLADRVLVVVGAGTLSISDAARLRTSLGRRSGVGVLLVGLNAELVQLPDRAGEAQHFWTAHQA